MSSDVSKEELLDFVKVGAFRIAEHDMLAALHRIGTVLLVTELTRHIPDDLFQTLLTDPDGAAGARAQVEIEDQFIQAVALHNRFYAILQGVADMHQAVEEREHTGATEQ